MANSRSSYCLHRRNAGYQVVHGCPCTGSVSFNVWGASPGDGHRVGRWLGLCSEGHPCKRAEPNGHLGVSCR